MSFLLAFALLLSYFRHVLQTLHDSTVLLFKDRISRQPLQNNLPAETTVLEIVLSESDIGIELEVAELQVTELELS